MLAIEREPVQPEASELEMAVTPGLGEIRGALRTFADRFDPALYSAADASVVMEHAARIEKMAATVKALAAKRVADTELWRRGGDRSPAHHLARATGTSVGEARDAIDTAAKLSALPDVDRAARAGRLSPRQASAIADAAAVDPAQQRNLLDVARRSSLRELQDECHRIKAASVDSEENYRRIHRERSVRTWTDRGGAAHLHATGPADHVAAMLAALEPGIDERFHAARRNNRPEPRQAYAFDALRQALDAGAAAPGDAGEDGPGGPRKRANVSRPKIIVRIDWDALVRGWPAHGETCEIAGVGAVPVSVVRRMIETADPFLAAVVTRGVDVVNVAHLKRSATAFQRTALDWLAPQCAVEGCCATAPLQIDHTQDWAATRVTLLTQLDRLCPHHHDLKTHHRWALVAGRGKRLIVPPDHPDHPGSARTHGPPGGAA